MGELCCQPTALGRLVIAASTLLFVLVIGPGLSAQEVEPVRVPPPSGHHSRFGSSSGSPDQPAHPSNSTGWWLGSSGIALVLAACGALCVAARKYRPQSSAGLLSVVGKVSLSPRHSIFLVKTGARVLLIGTGSQGAPSLLGELDQQEQNGEKAAVPDTRPRTSSIRLEHSFDPPRASPRRGSVVDVRLGDDE